MGDVTPVLGRCSACGKRAEASPGSWWHVKKRCAAWRTATFIPSASELLRERVTALGGFQFPPPASFWIKRDDVMSLIDEIFGPNAS